MSEVWKDTEIETKLPKQFKRGENRYLDSRFLGTRATGIFRLKGFRP